MADKNTAQSIVDIDFIGPTTAKKLKTLGIITLPELAEMSLDDAGSLAEQIAQRGVDAERVKGWIAQAREIVGASGSDDNAGISGLDHLEGEDVVALPDPEPVSEPTAETPPQVEDTAQDVEPAKETAPPQTPAEASAVPTLRELNMRARKIDAEHAERRRRAMEAADKAAAAELGGVTTLSRPRRIQKDLRPLVVE